jgi:hypothetical protein
MSKNNAIDKLILRYLSIWFNLPAAAHGHGSKELNYKVTFGTFFLQLSMEFG